MDTTLTITATKTRALAQLRETIGAEIGGIHLIKALGAENNDAPEAIKDVQSIFAVVGDAEIAGLAMGEIGKFSGSFGQLGQRLGGGVGCHRALRRRPGGCGRRRRWHDDGIWIQHLRGSTT